MEGQQCELPGQIAIRKPSFEATNFRRLHDQSSYFIREQGILLLGTWLRFGVHQVLGAGAQGLAVGAV